MTQTEPLSDNLLDEIVSDALDLDLGAPRGGVPTTSRIPAAKIEAEVVRPLEEEDLALLGSGQVGVHPPSLKRIRATHHKLAQLLASGLRDAECSRITGYSLSRISILKADPAFGELLHHYTENKAKEFETIQAKLATLTEDALDEIAARLDETPEEFTPAQLLNIVMAVGDRAGYAPIQRTENRNVSLNFTGDDLRKMKQDAEAQENIATQRRKLAVEHGRVIEQTSDAPKAETAQGEPGEGKDL